MPSEAGHSPAFFRHILSDLNALCQLRIDVVACILNGNHQIPLLIHHCDHLTAIAAQREQETLQLLISVQFHIFYLILCTQFCII